MSDIRNINIAKHDIGGGRYYVGFCRAANVELGYGTSTTNFGTLSDDTLYTSEFYGHDVKIDAIAACFDNYGVLSSCEITISTTGFECLGEEVVIEFDDKKHTVKLEEGANTFNLFGGRRFDPSFDLSDFLNNNQGSTVGIKVYLKNGIKRDYNNHFIQGNRGGSIMLDVTKGPSDGFLWVVPNDLRKIEEDPDTSGILITCAGHMASGRLTLSNPKIYGDDGSIDDADVQDTYTIQLNDQAKAIVTDATLCKLFRATVDGATLSWAYGAATPEQFFTRYQCRLLEDATYGNERHFNRLEWNIRDDEATNNLVYFNDLFMGHEGKALNGGHKVVDGKFGFVEKIFFSSIEDLSTKQVTHEGHIVFNESVYPQRKGQPFSIKALVNHAQQENSQDGLVNWNFIDPLGKGFEGKFTFDLAQGMFRGNNLGQCIHAAQDKSGEVWLSFQSTGSFNWQGDVIGRAKTGNAPGQPETFVLDDSREDGRLLTGQNDDIDAPLLSAAYWFSGFPHQLNINGYQFDWGTKVKEGSVYQIVKADGNQLNPVMVKVDAIAERPFPEYNTILGFSSKKEHQDFMASMMEHAVDFKEVVIPKPESQNTTMLPYKYQHGTLGELNKPLAFGFQSSRRYHIGGNIYPNRIDGYRIGTFAFAANEIDKSVLFTLDSKVFDDPDDYDPSTMVGKSVTISFKDRVVGTFEIVEISKDHPLYHVNFGDYGFVFSDEVLQEAIRNYAQYPLDNPPVFLNITSGKPKPKWFSRYIANVREGRTVATNDWRGNQLILWEDFQLMMEAPVEEREEIFNTMSKIFDDNDQDVFLPEQLFRDHDKVNMSQSKRDQLMTLCQVFLLPNQKDLRQGLMSGMDICQFTNGIEDFDFRQAIRSWLEKTR